MSHRTQITLTDEQYEDLCEESARTGVSISAIIRRRLAEARYGAPSKEELLRALDESFGAWKDRDLDGAEYVERIRPGLGARLER